VEISMQVVELLTHMSVEVLVANITTWPWMWLYWPWMWL